MISSPQAPEAASSPGFSTPESSKHQPSMGECYWRCSDEAGTSSKPGTPSMWPISTLKSPPKTPSVQESPREPCWGAGAGDVAELLQRRLHVSHPTGCCPPAPASGGRPAESGLLQAQPPLPRVQGQDRGQKVQPGQGCGLCLQKGRGQVRGGHGQRVKISAGGQLGRLAAGLQVSVLHRLLWLPGKFLGTSLSNGEPGHSVGQS